MKVAELCLNQVIQKSTPVYTKYTTDDSYPFKILRNTEEQYIAGQMIVH